MLLTLFSQVLSLVYSLTSLIGYQNFIVLCTRHVQNQPLLQANFPNCDISCIWISPQTKQPMRAILQVVYGKNCAILGGMLFAWQQTIAWVVRKMGKLLADVVCFEVQCLKNLLNLVFTHLPKADESI